MSGELGDKRYVCSYKGCGKKFIKKSKLTRHYVTHTNVRPYVCNYSECGKRYKDKDALKRHQINHTAERKYVCTFPQCTTVSSGKKFASMGLLHIHYRRHQGDKPYAFAYPQCDKKFQDYSNFVRHKKGHIVDRPRQQCGKRFAIKECLTSYSSTHTDACTYNAITAFTLQKFNFMTFMGLRTI